MKLLLCILLGIALAEAKPQRPERLEDKECSDILPGEACKMIALNRGCRDEDAAANCRKTCKVCKVCGDTNENYCQVAKEEGTLDCNGGKLADFCAKSCGKCSEGKASNTKDKTKKLRTGGEVCKDKSSYHCRTKKAEGLLDCSLSDWAEYCQKTCGTCNERKDLRKENKESTRKLRRSLRGEDDCTDDEDVHFCSEMLIKGICNDPAYKAEVSKCAKTCGLCFECQDLSNLCGTGNIDVCGQEDLEHFCLKACNKCDEPSQARALMTRAKRALSNPEAGDPLAHLLREETACKDISSLCDKTDIDVCDKKNHLLHFCLNTCNNCNARSIARSLKMVEQMTKEDKEAKDPLAHLMREKKKPAPSSPECADISPVCPHDKDADICEHEDLVQYCLKTCGKCSARSMERALETFAKLAVDHPKVKDPLAFLMGKNKGQKKPTKRETDCKDISTYCSKFIDDPTTSVDICGNEQTLVHCLKTCNKCDQRSILPKALKMVEDPLMDLVRLETCADKNLVHCMKVANDNYCVKEELAKECPKTCGLCGTGRKKRSPDALLHLDGKCKDDAEHCEEIKQQGLCEHFETNHICKLTCGLC